MGDSVTGSQGVGMSELLPCPKCSSTKVQVLEVEEAPLTGKTKFVVHCHICQYETPERSTEAEALDCWAAAYWNAG
jgi:hypothetical protein